jgi:CheY-like chemotaxis protein/tRNA A-37 threonylcarbamoyl transferase component Bud32
MAQASAATIAQQALKLGLLTQDQLDEGWVEAGGRQVEAEALLAALERKGYLTPWQSQKLLKGETAGYFLGGYRILYKIASGSFGRVYRGDDPATGRIVAVKVLRGRWTDKPESVKLFEREGRVGLALRHPNIVEILAVNCDAASKQYFIVMEFVEGGNLRELLKIQKKLDPLKGVRILEDVAAGLAYAASKGITHRDMKLTNVLLSSQGAAKLVDFGLAGMEKLVHKDEATKVDRTVDYAGLERATGVNPGDPRSDLYFLGCVAYELLTGRSPLEMRKDVRRRMLKERFSSVKRMTSEDVPGAPPSVFRLVETLMALDPSQRYQTATQALEAIREVRREVEEGAGKAVGAAAQATPAGSVFIVEKDQRLQDTLRQKFKEEGFRVLLAADPVRAVDRFRQQPYQALITDVGTVGEDGLFLFERVLREADRLKVPFTGIIILSQDQQDWATRVEKRPGVDVLVRPVTLKQLFRKLQELLAAANGKEPPK